jgi:hypothetical protein
VKFGIQIRIRDGWTSDSSMQAIIFQGQIDSQNFQIACPRSPNLDRQQQHSYDSAHCLTNFILQYPAEASDTSIFLLLNSAQEALSRHPQEPLGQGMARGSI